MGSIVVGIDESAGAAEALRWAAREAELRGWSLTAVLCWSYLDQHHGTAPHAFDAGYTADDADAAARTITMRVLGEGATAVERRTVNDVPARGLLETSADADLLVLGARGLGPFRSLLLGSVSQHCLHHATVPVAIVRATANRPIGRPRVVVGVDGSATAQRALEWAVEEARLRLAVLEVVHAWNPPALAVPTMALDYGIFDDAAHAIVAEALAQVDTSGLPGPVVRVVEIGTGGRVLVDQADGADLVVVGSRGLGGFKGLLLGSVSHQVAQHAVCPVVVIPQSEPDGPGVARRTTVATGPSPLSGPTATQDAEGRDDHDR
jgi:nucleotide-binding universal stress UspA family protein